MESSASPYIALQWKLNATVMVAIPFTDLTDGAAHTIETSFIQTLGSPVTYILLNKRFHAGVTNLQNRANSYYSGIAATSWNAKKKEIFGLYTWLILLEQIMVNEPLSELTADDYKEKLEEILDI
jgi:hypothetical protein